MRIHVSSLGCKLNQSEMEALADRLVQDGHHIVATPAEAELCILNTCAVTHVAAQKSRQALRRLHRENPCARLVATGCYAELAPADVQDLPGVELVAGNHDKGRLPEILGNNAPEHTAGFPASPAAQPSEREGNLPCPAPERGDASRFRTRALVKIQDGCDNACTYCIIHVARGSQRSRSADEVLDEVRSRLATGHKEVVLTGVHIGAYGRDRGRACACTPFGRGAPADPGMDLWSLVDRILAETDVPRLRLSSIEPWDLPAKAFNLWENPRLCRHLHLPLQSGCDATLRRMARRYTSGEFARLVAAARAAISDLAVTSDVIVGFPGETEGEFAESLAAVETARFARVHVFAFSPRPGTPAAAMPDQVPPPVKDERARTLRVAGAAAERAFQQRFVGHTMDVLWESSRSGPAGRAWNGLTDNYLRVHTISSEDLANILTPTRLTAWLNDELLGRIVTQESGG